MAGHGRSPRGSPPPSVRVRLASDRLWPLPADRRRPASGIWLGVLGFILYQSARAAQVQSDVVLCRISGMTVRDVMDREPVAIPGADQRRDGARRVLPALPVAVVPGRRRCTAIPRPAQPRRRRRRSRAEAHLGDRRRGRRASTRRVSCASPKTPHSSRCSATRTCAGWAACPQGRRRGPADRRDHYEPGGPRAAHRAVELPGRRLVPSGRGRSG